MRIKLSLFSGPFVSALANRYGFRLVAILGSVISCAAFVLAFFSTSIEFLYISYGVIGKFFPLSRICLIEAVGVSTESCFCQFLLHTRYSQLLYLILWKILPRICILVLLTFNGSVVCHHIVIVQFFYYI